MQVPLNNNSKTNSQTLLPHLLHLAFATCECYESYNNITKAKSLQPIPSQNTMTSSNLHIMGFKPPMQYDDPLHKIFLAHQITEDAGLNIEYGSIHYIIGNVWNTLTHNFEPGPGANIIINANITQDDINHINNAHRKDHLSGLIFLLGHKYKSDYNNNNWYRNDTENTIAFDRFTIPNSLTNTPKVNAKPINLRLSARTTCTSTTYIIPQHRQNCIAPQSTSNIAPVTQSIKQPHTDPPKDPSRDPNAASLPLQTIPNGNTNVDNADAKNNIKCDILLTFKTASNIYCANNDEQNANLTTNPLTTPYTHRFKVPTAASRTPQTTILVPTKWNEQIHITKNNSQKHGYAIMRALMHYKSSLYLMFGVVLSILLSLPSISASLTSTGYVLNVENSNGSLILMKDINVINSQYIDNANDLSLIILKL